jgi:importin subunit beta-1
VRKVAYECISNIAALYYDKLEAYMQVLFDLTIKTISQDEKEVALQALEFWSTLCDEELEIMEDAKYDVEPARRSMNYIPMALSHLIPLLLECLTKQEEDGDDDDWGVAEAGGTCLSLCAQVVGDDVVDLIVPFVTQNIQASSTPDSWRSREAAIMAFGAVLDGPSNQKLSPLVQSAMPVLISAMRDSHVLVKDTATWTIGKICELHVRSIPEAVVPQLVQHLIIALEDSARVCSRACYALHMFGEAFEPNRDDATNALSPYFTAVVQKLLGVMNREDWAEDNMRVQAMEALNVLVQNSAKDVVSYVLSMLDVVLSMLETSFNMQVLSTDDRERQQGLQSLLCGATAVICHKIKKDVIPHGDRIMTLLLRVFQNKHAIAQEEAFMAAGALADQLEGNFNKYMQAFHPVLIQGLSNYEEHQVCSVAVGVVGDLCRALEAAILSYSDDIVRCLLQNLQNASINRNVKPPVLACLGDIALAVGGNFEKYLDITMSMLLQAQNVCSVINNDGDDEFLEYINQLREGILEAYSGIIQGLNDGNKAGLLLPYVTGIVTFLEALAQDVDKEESVLRHAIGVVGDIATTIGPQAAPMLKGRLHLQRLVEEGLSSEPSTQGTAQWAMEILKKL